jgi:O-antigen ligase
MKCSLRPASSEAGLSFYGLAILGAMLVFAPLIMGGNRPLPLLILELAAVILLCLHLLQLSSIQPLSRPLLILLGGLVALPLVQLFPLPEFVWNWLPGRSIYGVASSAVGSASGYRSLSLIPKITETALLALLVPIAVFLATVSTSEAQLKQLTNLFIGLAVLQAIIGLAQFGTGSMTVLPGFEGEAISAAHGTYPNSDHLAGFLEMALPVALGLLIANIQIGNNLPSNSIRKMPIRQRISRLFSSGIRFNRVAIYGAAGLAILLGLTFSHSRTGVALAMLGILVCSLVFGSRVGGQRSSRLVVAFTVIAIALSLEIGLTSVLSRFTSKGMTDDMRWSIYAATIQGIREFFPIGSGLGTYPAVFRRFQPGNIPDFVNHAHNDYLEWLFEGGLVAALLMVGFLALYLMRWRKVWPREDYCPPYCFIRISAGIGLLLMGLHGMIDFNLHIPANAVYFAFLAGVFFHQANPAEARQSPRSPKVRGEPAATTPAQAPKPAALPEPPAPASNIRNPFAD